jgi:fibronectin-binding autotransporter adhesin
MKPLQFVASACIAAWLAPLTALGVTDTWDGNGGVGVNNNIGNNLNWLDDTAPASDLVNTDVVFAGTDKLTPNAAVAFSTHSLVFNNTAGAFVFGGQQLNVGTGGILNSDAQTMTFNNAVSFSGVANATVNPAAGGLTFVTTVALPTGTLTVTGSNPTSFKNISGTSALNKTGAGTMTWAPNISTGFDLTIGNGTVTTASDGSADVFTSTATIAVNGTSIFNIDESLTLDGAQLTRATGATINLAAAKTLTIQNGGDMIVTGLFTNSTASTIAVTGAGSTISATNALGVAGGSSLNISGGAAGSSSGAVNIAHAGGDGAATVDGTGSSLDAGSLNLAVSGATGTLTYTNGSTGSLGSIAISNSGTSGTKGTLTIESGSSVTGANLLIAPAAGSVTGTTTVTGAGSILAISGAASSIIGPTTSAGTGLLNVSDSGTFDSGTGLTTVNKKGTIAIAGGIYNSHGDLTLTIGQLTRDASGVFALDAGHTLTVQSGGDAVFTGSFTDSTASTILVTGKGSTLGTTTTLGIQGGAALNIAAEGKVSATGLLSIGTSSGNGTVTVDGNPSSLAVNGLNVASNGNTASLTFSNGSVGTLGSIGVAASNTAGTNGTVTIQSGADVMGTGIIVGTLVGLSTGTINVTGANSRLTLSGGTSTVGASGGSTATVKVDDGGTLVTAPGVMNVNPSGSLTVTAGGILTGLSDFGGTGQINISGVYSPGNSAGGFPTTSVSFAQDMTFQPTTFIQMELAGITPDTEHDQLVFNGPGATQVTWNGNLLVQLINGFVPKAGDSFDLLDFDPARSTGSFSIGTPALPAGLFWRTDEIYNTGAIRVSVTSDTYAQWQQAFGLVGQFDQDDDSDGLPNGIEFLLGTDPTAPFTEYPFFEIEPVVSAVDITGGVAFKIPADPSGDAHYRIHASSDLLTWTLIASKDGSGPWATFETASVTTGPAINDRTDITISETLALATSRRFHRLIAEAP